MGDQGGISNRKVRKKSPFVLKYDRYIYFLPYWISVVNRKNENLKVGSWQRRENKLCREKGLEELREINVEVTAESLGMIGWLSKWERWKHWRQTLTLRWPGSARGEGETDKERQQKNQVK